MFGALMPVVLISDSKAIQDYYRRRYKRNTYFIPYGANLYQSQNRAILEKFGLKAGEYFLQITRFEPENNPLLTRLAFEGLDTKWKLVLVGGVTYPSAYSQRLFSTEDPRVIFTGFIYDQDVLRELLTNCYAYIHGNEVGGTNPALLTAMGAGCFVLALDTPYNREVLGEAGIYFPPSVTALREKMNWSLQEREEVARGKEKARAIIRQRYNWEAVTDKYEALFRALSKGYVSGLEF